VVFFVCVDWVSKISINDGNVEEKYRISVKSNKGFILNIRKQEQADIITKIDLIKEKIKER
jgi:multidrug efflux pump subunit AcrB